MPSPMETLAAVTGFAGIFLPFAGGYSALTALADGFAPTLAAAALLSPLITYLALRFLASGSLTSTERGLGWLVSAGFLGIYCWGWFLSLVVSTQASSIAWGGVSSAVILFLPLLLLGLGAWITFRTARHQGRHSHAPILALRTMYIVNAAFGLSAFYDGWEVGAWAILVAAMAHLYLMTRATSQVH